jgi:DNA end-binding protein Ku
MLRSMWKGSISFGLVNVPVKLYSATESKTIKFRHLHKKCLSPIEYKKYCPVCEQEVGMEDIVRGYEYEKGRFVIINDEDLEKIPEANTRTIDIIDFVDLVEIDPIYFDRTYFLAPEETGSKAYVLLKNAMQETEKIAVAKVVIRSKQNLACIRVYGDCLVMETMFFPYEIRDAKELPAFKQPELHANEIKMATQLINSLSEKFDPTKYTDDYRGALMEMIQKKIEGEEINIPAAKGAGRVVDLMEALKASLEAVERDKPKAKSETKKPGRKAKKKQTG